MMRNKEKEIERLSKALYLYSPGIKETMEKDLKPTIDFELTFEDGSTLMVGTFGIPKPFVKDEQLAELQKQCINLTLNNGHYVVSARLVLRRKRRIHNMVTRLRGGQFVAC